MRTRVALEKNQAGPTPKVSITGTGKRKGKKAMAGPHIKLVKAMAIKSSLPEASGFLQQYCYFQRDDPAAKTFDLWKP